MMDYTPGSNVAAGDVVVVGSIVGVSTRAITANILGALSIYGIFNFAKSAGSGTAIAAGTKVYWDASNEVVTTTAGSNKCIGYTVEACTDDDTDVDVFLARA